MEGPATSTATSSHPVEYALATNLSPNLSNIHHLLNVKLDKSNYHMWRSQFPPIFRAHDLMGFIDGSLTSPPPLLPDSEPHSAYSKWYQQDHLILSWLISSITEPLFAQVLRNETASSMWKALSSIFASTSQARLQQLEYQIRTTKKGSSTMLDFLLHIKFLAHQLALAGSPLTNQQLVTCILAGLGHECASLVASITARLEPIIIEDFTVILLNHDIMFSEKPIDTLLPAFANNATTRSSTTPLLSASSLPSQQLSSRGAHY